MKFLFLDCETGGIDPKYASLLQLYAAVFDSELNDVDNIELKIKPSNSYQVSAKALEVNRINLVEHDKVSISYAEASTQLHNFLSENTKGGKEKLTVVGWNVHFDLHFITEHLISKSQWEQFVSYRVFDLQPVGAMLKLTKTLPDTIGGSLGSYAEYFGADISKAHDAREDVKLTVAVFKGLKEAAELGKQAYRGE